MNLDDQNVAALYDRAADAWTRHSASGGDLLRDEVNTPGFLALLPDVRGLLGLEIGCGDGHHSRLLTARGARMIAMDLSAGMVRATRRAGGTGIWPVRSTAGALPLPDGSVDFVVAVMSLMDMAAADQAIREAARVLKPSGFFQFSIAHPCTFTPRWGWLRDASGRPVAATVGGYFDQGPRVERWGFAPVAGEAPGTTTRWARLANWIRRRSAPPVAAEIFEIARFPHPLHWWLNQVADAGLRIVQVAEPAATPAQASQDRRLAGTRVVAHFLHVLSRR